MILGAGGRCDVVAFYSHWLKNRFREGVVFSRNPLFPHKVVRYILSPDKIDAVVLRSQNFAPILDFLPELCAKYRVFCEVVLCGYGSEIRPNLPTLGENLKVFSEMEKILTKKRLLFRYEPIFLTEAFTAARHAEVFEEICATLSGHVAKGIARFAEKNIILKRIPKFCPTEGSERTFLEEKLPKIAAKYKIPFHFCANGEKFATDCPHEGCVTLDLLSEAFSVPFAGIPHRGNRKGCSCIEIRDIGSYDACPGKCLYCTLNRDRTARKENLARHNPDSPLLIGNLMPEDNLSDAIQRSFLGSGEGQMSFLI